MESPWLRFDAILCSAVCLVLLGPSELSAQEQGTVCLARQNWPPDALWSPDVSACDSGRLSVKVDNREGVEWPRDKGTLLPPLDLKPRHRVTITCDGKPWQSFFFRFTEFDRERNLCLFIGGYATAQLWQRKRAPRCTCDSPVR